MSASAIKDHKPAVLARFLLLLLLLAPLAHAQGWLLGGIDDVPEPQPESVVALLLVANQARASVGLPPLTQDEGLARAARQHAAELAQRGLLDHASPTPGRETVAARLARAGVPYTSHGENLAMVPAGLDLAPTTVSGWLSSPPHRANLLDPSFDRVGFGTAVDARGGRYVVQVLAAVPWAPGNWSVWQGVEEVRELSLEVEAISPISALFEVAGAHHPRSLSTGRQRLSLPVPLTGAVDLRIGLLTSPPSGYTVDEQGRVDELGRWQPGSAPRRGARVVASAWGHRVTIGAHLDIEIVGHAPGLELLVANEHLPGARVADGRISAFLPWPASGLIELALAEGSADGRLLLRHAFRLRRTADGIVWEVTP